MEQERNPNKNAELAMEQNGNMIDGINKFTNIQKIIWIRSS